jgi:alkyl hydroperoxide reductase subunit AhpC
MIYPNEIDHNTVRNVFIIGPDKGIKVPTSYPVSAGHNFDELILIIDSLNQLPIMMLIHRQIGMMETTL